MNIVNFFTEFCEKKIILFGWIETPTLFTYITMLNLKEKAYSVELKLYFSQYRVIYQTQ